MPEKTTYLLPVWVDLTCKNPDVILSALNDALVEFFEEQCDLIAKAGLEVNVQWSINKHMNLYKGAQNEQSTDN